MDVVLEEDVEFLEMLNGKLTCQRWQGSTRFFPRRQVMDYTLANLTKDEFDRVLGLMNQRDFFIEPGSDTFGFNPAFAVYYVDGSISGGELEARRVLDFREPQFPKGATWAKVSEVYMGKRNLELLRNFGRQEPVTDRNLYDY